MERIDREVMESPKGNWRKKIWLQIWFGVLKRQGCKGQINTPAIFWFESNI